MCLGTVTKTIKLKKDKTVYKVLASYDPEYETYCYIHDHREAKYKSGLQNAKIVEISSSWPLKTYNSGFHCFVQRKGCLVFGGFMSKIVKCTIPAGTKVTYGFQDDASVIVTPVLIFPKLESKKGI